MRSIDKYINEFKSIRRDKEKRVIAGVCSGISEKFNLELTLTRVLFFIAAFFSGAGIIVYLIFWAIIPERNSRIVIKDITDNK